MPRRRLKTILSIELHMTSEGFSSSISPFPSVLRESRPSLSIDVWPEGMFHQDVRVDATPWGLYISADGREENKVGYLDFSLGSGLGAIGTGMRFLVGGRSKCL